jgi:uroporphyrinogen-III synthase
VALLEARKGSEMAELVRSYGAIVRSVPAVREVALDCGAAVAEFLARLDTPARRVHVFLTAAGTTALLVEAERQNRLPFLIDSLRRGTIVCRGPKPTAALKRYGLNPHISTPPPYTTTEMLDALASIDLAGTEVTVVHYGERSEPLAAAFRERGAALNELCVYEWRLPDDIAPLQNLVRDIVKREIDAVIFTSQVQWQHLWRVADDLLLGDAVVRALRTEVVAAAVGPICSAALIQAGIDPRVVPDNPKMGPLVAALARYFSRLNALPDP